MVDSKENDKFDQELKGWHPNIIMKMFYVHLYILFANDMKNWFNNQSLFSCGSFPLLS